MQKLHLLFTTCWKTKNNFPVYEAENSFALARFFSHAAIYRAMAIEVQENNQKFESKLMERLISSELN